MTDPTFRFFRFTHGRRAGLLLCGASCAVILAAIATQGCGSSSSGGNTDGTDSGGAGDTASSGDTGSAGDTAKGDSAKTDTGGGSDTATDDTGTPTDGGTDTATKDGASDATADASDVATDASSDAGPAPFGTKLAAGDFTIVGVTSDNYAIVLENVSNALQAIPLAGGAATTVATTADAVEIHGKVVFAWHDLDADGIGGLITWTSASGPKTASTASFASSSNYPTSAGASDDGTTIVYSDAAVSALTGNLVMSALDGTGKKTLTAIDTNGCGITLQRAGSRFVSSYCTDAAGTVTVASFDDTGTKATLLTPAREFFSVDTAGTKVFVITPANAAKVLPIAGGTAVSIDTNVGFGAMRPDAAGVIYRVQTGTPLVKTLKKANVDGTGITTLMATGFGSFVGLAPNGNTVMYFVNSDTTTGSTDLFLASTVTAGSPVTLSATTTADPGNFGSTFTADSTHALFATDLDSDGAGTLKAATVTSGTAVSIGTKAWFAAATTGAKVVLTDNFTAGATGSPDRGDLHFVDTSGTATPTLLQAKTDLNFGLDAAKGKVVYTYSFVPAHMGLYVGALP